MYQRALTTRVRLLGPENPLTRDTRQRLQAVLGELDQAKEATRLEAMHHQQEGRTAEQKHVEEE